MQPESWGLGPHLGLLPELLPVNPLHFHSCISFLIGGALQSQTASRERGERAECSGSSHPQRVRTDWQRRGG